MNISDVKDAYCAYYEAYQTTKNPPDQSAPEQVQRLQLAGYYGLAEDQYQTFKQCAREWSNTHPGQADKMDQILSQTRILRHRQKDAEREFYAPTMSGKPFCQLVGQPKQVEAKLTALSKKLAEPAAFLNGCQKQWEEDLTAMDRELEKTIAQLLKPLAKSSVAKDKSYQEKIAQEAEKLKLEHFSSDTRTNLVKDIEEIQAYTQYAEKEFKKGLSLLSKAKANYKAARGTANPAATMRSLEKLDRMSIKIARFHSIFMTAFLLSRPEA